ncbi:MAG TPA: non-homologous end-joining DNA ligase [Solirubrobacterales bacterium]|nr:non-homologous end-joining DNA ligase [Solirubrobacterales bacterium]
MASTTTPTLRPMLATEASTPPEDGGWAFEIKWDGVRALAHTDGEGGLRIESRRGEDITARYPELAGLGEALAGRRVILDGEIVTFDDGRPSFQRLQLRMGLTSPMSIQRRAPTCPATYEIFDLLELDGEPTLELPYEERRRLLEELELDGPSWQTPAHRLGDGSVLLEAARARGLEGVVAKRLDSPYRPGRRTGEWVKVRNWRRQEFVVGGWMPGEGGRSGLMGSLLVGYWDSTPDEARGLERPPLLVYAGGVGSGFRNEEIERLTRMLTARSRDETPFDVGRPKRPGARFCDPELVCEVQFSEWTHEGTLRQPSYKGLREDKDAREVVREQ